MKDWIGFGFIILLLVFAYVGLRALSKKKVRTEEEFEKGAAVGSTLGATFMSAINGLFDPSVKKGEKAVSEIKQGARRKKRGDGNANTDDIRGDK